MFKIQLLLTISSRSTTRFRVQRTSFSKTLLSHCYKYLLVCVEIPVNPSSGMSASYPSQSPIPEGSKPRDSRQCRVFVGVAKARSSRQIIFKK